MIELDGVPVTADQISALALYNYGHFTSMRVENGRVRGLSLHCERLATDCIELFGVPLDSRRVRDLVARLTPECDGSRIVRVTIFDPELDMGLPGAPLDPHILVTARPASETVCTPMRLATALYERGLPRVKHVGLFETIRARRTAQLAGFDDVLFVGPGDEVMEGATWNVGFLQGDRIVWPKAEMLPGVTMRLVDRLAHTLGIDVEERTVLIRDIPEVTGAFATNAAVGVRPITSIGAVTFDPAAAMIGRLQRAYCELVGDRLVD